MRADRAAETVWIVAEAGLVSSASSRRRESVRINCGLRHQERTVPPPSNHASRRLFGGPGAGGPISGARRLRGGAAEGRNILGQLTKHQIAAVASEVSQVLRIRHSGQEAFKIEGGREWN